MTNLADLKKPWRVGVLGVAIIWLGAGLTARADVKVGTLRVGTETYENVTVTSKTADSLFITHAKGFANVKLADVSPEVLAQLGFDPARVKLMGKRSIALEDLPIDPQLLAMKDKFASQVGVHLKGFDTVLIVSLWCALFGGYLFFCYCCQLICQKAGGKPGIAVWIPILQYLPLLQAARMSGIWFLLVLFPLATPLLVVPLLKIAGPHYLWILFVPYILPALAYLIWCVRICRARGIGEWVAVFLILPPTNLFAFLYLAFSSSGAKTVVKGGKQQAAAPVRHTTAQDTAFFFQT